MKKLFAAAAAIALVGCGSSDRSPIPPIGGSTQSGGDKQAAIAAIQKLNANTETGLSLTTYPPLVAEAKTAIEPLQGDSQGVTAAKDALKAHEIALKYWQCDVAEANGGDQYEAQDQCRDDVLKAQVFPAYPDLQQQINQAYEAKNKPKYLSNSLDNKAILQVLWQKASESGAIAQKEL